MSPPDEAYSNKELFNTIREIEQHLSDDIRSVDNAAHSIDKRLGAVEIILEKSLLPELKELKEKVQRLQMAVFVLAPLAIMLIGTIVAIVRG